MNQIEQITSQSEEKSQEIKKQKSRAASAHTTKGQILEKWCPFLEHPELTPIGKRRIGRSWETY